MDWFIKTIEIANFKYAHNVFRLDFGNEKKNLLLYGENGCGKSTIYWALYTLYQSYFKENPDEVRKYFDVNNHQNLLNRYHNSPDQSLISVEYGDCTGGIKNLRLAYHDTSLVRSGDSFVQNTATNSDFMNYKALTSFFDFRNSMATDVFPFFEKELLPLLDLTDKCHHIMDDGETITSYAGEWWSYLNTVPLDLPKNAAGWIDVESEDYGKFIDAISDFNTRLQTQLGILEADTKDMLVSKFNVADIDVKFEFTGAEFNRVWAQHPHLRDEKLHCPIILIKAIVDREIIAQEDKKQIAHPKTFFNEAQLTKIALAIRLALFEARSDSTASNANALLCIDDMLVSLDMANRMDVINILLDYADAYQVIILTHDRAFYNMFRMEIDSRHKSSEWLYKQMFILDEGMSTDPVPEPTIVDDKDNMQMALLHIHNRDFAAAGNYLRKECETVLQKLYMRNEVLAPNSDGTIKKLELAKLIQYIPKFLKLYGLPNGLGSHLNSYRKAILNPMSHADIDTPFFYREIMACKAEIEVLRSMEKTLLREREIDNEETFVISVNKNATSQEVKFTFIEQMAKISYTGTEHYRNSLVRISSLTPPMTGYTMNDTKRVKDVFEAACRAVGMTATERPSLNTAIKVAASALSLD